MQESDQPVQQNQRWADANALGSHIVFGAGCRHLPSLSLREPGFEVAKTPVNIGVGPRAFNKQFWLSPLDRDEVDLTAVRVAEVAQLQVAATRVLFEVHPLEEMRGDQVFD